MWLEILGAGTLGVFFLAKQALTHRDRRYFAAATGLNFNEKDGSFRGDINGITYTLQFGFKNSQGERDDATLLVAQGATSQGEFALRSNSVLAQNLKTQNNFTTGDSDFDKASRFDGDTDLLIYALQHKHRKALGSIVAVTHELKFRDGTLCIGVSGTQFARAEYVLRIAHALMSHLNAPETEHERVLLDCVRSDPSERMRAHALTRLSRMSSPLLSEALSIARKNGKASLRLLVAQLTKNPADFLLVEPGALDLGDLESYWLLAQSEEMRADLKRHVRAILTTSDHSSIVARIVGARSALAIDKSDFDEILFEATRTRQGDIASLCVSALFSEPTSVHASMLQALRKHSDDKVRAVVAATARVLAKQNPYLSGAISVGPHVGDGHVSLDKEHDDDA
jgi:hypothetical protein